MIEFYYIFLYFLIYSVIGTVMEIVTLYIDEKKLSFNRGFLIGPYIPIYGIGSLLIIYIVSYISTNIFLVFIFSFIFCAILEYITSYLMEVIFKITWWDYTKCKYNLNGRIELFRLISFGVTGVLLINFMHPFFSSLITNTSDNIIYIVGTILLVIFIFDYILSFFLAMNLKSKIKKIVKMDNTDLFKKEVSNYFKKNFLVKRLVSSYPNIKKYIKKITRL